MRIISGKARGTKLFTLEGEQTRPTLDRVKESFFNIIQNDIRDCTFLDLFAGSGAIGLEAASRGAKKVILCDQAKQAMKIIEKNVEKTHLQQQVECYQMSFETLLKTRIQDDLDFVYLDPPYQSDFVLKAIQILVDQNLVKKQTKIIIEIDDEQKITQQLENLPIQVIDKRKYGRAYLLFLKKDGA